MTRDDAIAQIATVTSLTPADVLGFLECSDEERLAIFQTYYTAGMLKRQSVWDDVLAIMKECAEIAGFILPVFGAVEGVFGIVALTKGA